MPVVSGMTYCGTTEAVITPVPWKTSLPIIPGLTRLSVLTRGGGRQQCSVLQAINPQLNYNNKGQVTFKSDHRGRIRKEEHFFYRLTVMVCMKEAGINKT